MVTPALSTVPIRSKDLTLRLKIFPYSLIFCTTILFILISQAVDTYCLLFSMCKQNLPILLLIGLFTQLNLKQKAGVNKRRVPDLLRDYILFGLGPNIFLGSSVSNLIHVCFLKRKILRRLIHFWERRSPLR